MKCNDVRENLMDLLAEGRGDPDVAAHVRQCSSCAQKLNSLRQTMNLLDEWQAPEPSPYFVTRVSARARELANQPVKSGLLGWLRKPALAVFMVAALAAGGLFYTLAPHHQTSTAHNQPTVEPKPGSAVADMEALDKNHDLFINTDLLDEISGGPSDDVPDSSDVQ